MNQQIMFQFWKYVKCTCSVVRQGRMVITAPEHVVTVRIVKHVTLMTENVIWMGVPNRGMNHLVVINVNQNFTALTVDHLAVCIVMDYLVTVLLENV